MDAVGMGSYGNDLALPGARLSSLPPSLSRTRAAVQTPVPIRPQAPIPPLQSISPLELLPATGPNCRHCHRPIARRPQSTASTAQSRKGRSRTSSPSQLQVHPEAKHPVHLPRLRPLPPCLPLSPRQREKSTWRQEKAELLPSFQLHDIPHRGPPRPCLTHPPPSWQPVPSAAQPAILPSQDISGKRQQRQPDHASN